MSWDVAIAVALLFGGAGYLALASFVWRRRHVPAAYPLLVGLLAIFVWVAGYTVEMTTRTPEAAAVWSTVKYVGIVLLAPSLLAFGVEYTSRGRRLGRRALAWLAVEPVLVMIVLCVPQWHHLMLPYGAGMYDHTPWPVPGNGPLFVPHAVYTYILDWSALTLLATRLLRLARPYRLPVLLIIGLAFTPFIGNIVYNFAWPVVDPTPFLFLVVMTTLVWGFLRLGLFDLVPIARSAVMEQMTDGVVVLDAYDRVIDVNPAASAMLGVSSPHLVGCYAEAVLPVFATALEAHHPGGSTQVEVATTADQLGRAGVAPVHLAVQLSSLVDRDGSEAGKLVVLRDVTQRAETEHKLRELLDAETHLATVLQTSLRPASLPAVPGVRLAARSLPAGLGSQVSGDFYDVHQALGGDWAFVLGDVAGKGVHAAVVTSMARYTVRTLSAQGWSPKQVIEQLNQALLVDVEPERFCTVVYGRIAERDTDVDGLPQPGIRLTIALGGHPAPLVRRMDGRIEAIGRSGTALGILPVVDIEEVAVDLEPGEVMVAFTDGVVEARCEGVEFGEERLAWTMATTASGLRGHTGAAAAALVADAVADRVMTSVTEFAEQRDDIAILVLTVA